MYNIDRKWKEFKAIKTWRQNVIRNQLCKWLKKMGSGFDNPLCSVKEYFTMQLL